MSRHLGLRTRVKRRLKRLGNRKPLPVIITGIYPEEQPGEAIGYEGAGVTVLAEPGEALETLRKRAAGEIPSRFIRTLYAPFPGAVEPVAAPIPAPAPAMPTFDRSTPEAWRGWRAFAEEGLKP